MADYDDMLLDFKIPPKGSDDQSLSKQKRIGNYILAFGKTLETMGKLPKGTLETIVDTINVYENEGETFRWKEIEKMLFDHLENYIFYFTSHSVLFNDITVGTLNFMKKIYDSVPEKKYLDRYRLNKLLDASKKLDDMVIYESEVELRKERRFSDDNGRKKTVKLREERQFSDDNGRKKTKDYKRKKDALRAEKGRIDIDE